MTTPFQLINAGTTQTCGSQCDNTTVKSQILCADKFKIGGFTTIDSTGATVQNVTGNVIAKTTTGNVVINLPDLPVGCVLYVIHESGTGTCTVNGGLTVGVLVPVCAFVSFIKSTGGWAKSIPSTG